VIESSRIVSDTRYQAVAPHEIETAELMPVQATRCRKLSLAESDNHDLK
jgi:hypothetical protein